ncbi:relaxase/mobilization nuclease domain-containing protein [Parvularcula marina]|uniref:relaxase/mobilization nuclease domain-containing protein n=1 Tax=Parvularcula marina TaxID=2292771 RepID=UPI003512A8DE
MILNASQRGGARQLASHLLNHENEQIDVHSLRGFASQDLQGAFLEAYAISKGTKCSQYLFSLSLSPPQDADVPTAHFEDAIQRIEEKLGLENQPRAIVFHEKEGRRHAHVVWSRIDTASMTAVQMSFYKLKLRDISRELFLEHGWTMPKGLADSQERDPRNFTLEEWQIAKRADRDPRDIKQALQDAWMLSDSRDAYIAALGERGFKLARGDRRSHIAVDHDGNIYAVAKWTGIKTKLVRAKLGPERDLPSIQQARQAFAAELIPHLEEYRAQAKARRDRDLDLYNERRRRMAERQKLERQSLKDRHNKRASNERDIRQKRFRRGLRGFWDRLTGKHRQIVSQNNREALHALERDRQERDTQIFKQLDSRRQLQKQKTQILERHRTLDQDLTHDIAKLNGHDLARENRELDERQRLERAREQERKCDRDQGFSL